MNTLSLRKQVAVSAFLIALASSPLFAGVVFQVETTYHSGSRSPESSQMYAEGKNLKMEVSSNRGSGTDEVIFRGDRREMVVVDHKEQSYMVIDSEALEQLGGQVQGQMQQAMKEMEKALEQLDPKQREMAEKMLKGKMGDMTGGAGAGSGRSPAEFRQTSERATKQGYPCVKYDMLRDGAKVRELWVTDWDNVKGGEEAVEAFKEMGDFFQELMDSFSKTLGGLGGAFEIDNMFEGLNQVDGFPVVTRSFDGGELESETVLESVSERDLSPDAFEPPKGYRLRTMGPS